MSEKQFLFTVVTPDKNFLKDQPVVAMGAKGSLGDFGVLAGHEPFLTDLKPGVVWYRDPKGEDSDFYVSGGFVEVLPERVTILADSAERLDEIDEEKAAKEHEAASRQLAAAKSLYAKSSAGAQEKVGLTPEMEEKIKQERIEIFKAEAALLRATARAQAARNKSKLQHKPKQ
jgi:F-type H+-transporting ATPase subunit epsilon